MGHKGGHSLLPFGVSPQPLSSSSSPSYHVPQSPADSLGSALPMATPHPEPQLAASLALGIPSRAWLTRGPHRAFLPLQWLRHPRSGGMGIPYPLQVAIPQCTVPQRECAMGRLGGSRKDEGQAALGTLRLHACTSSRGPISA